MVIRNVTVNDCTPETIVIGRRGTFETMQIVFDLTYLIENYGDGTAVLALKRSQDSSAYPAVAAQDGNTLTWVVSDVDTYYVGAGECQLMWYVDGGLAKTIIYPMVVMRDILATSEEAPDAYQEWVDALIAEGAETLQNAQDAAQSASDAESAKDDAVAAKEAAENAQEAAETAAQRAENALEEFTTPTASANTLAPNQPATASYNDGHFTFGIPKGDKGDKLTYSDLTEADKLDLIQGPIAEAQADAEQAVEDKGAEVAASLPEKVPNIAGLLTSVSDVVLVKNNNGVWGSGICCIYEKHNDWTFGGYVRSNGDRMYPRISGDAPVKHFNAHNWIDVALTWFGRDNLVHDDNNHNGLFSANCVPVDGKYDFDCSEFVGSVLLGITYDNSRYVGGTDSANHKLNYIGVTSFPPSNSSDRVNGGLLANEMARFFAEQGLLYAIPQNLTQDAFQPGDVLFFNSATTAPTYYQNINHVAIVADTVKDTVIIAESSGTPSNYGYGTTPIITRKINVIDIRSGCIAFARPNYHAPASNQSIRDYLKTGRLTGLMLIGTGVRTSASDASLTQGEVNSQSNLRMAATKAFIPVSAGEKIVYTGTPSFGRGTMFCRVVEYDKDYKYLGNYNICTEGSAGSRVIPEGTAYIRFWTGFSNQDGVLTIPDIDNNVRVSIGELTGDVDDLKSSLEDLTDTVDDLSLTADTLADTKAPVIYNTASGDIATFDDGANGMPIKSLVVVINPVQAVGTPSPTNPLPISGYTELNLYRESSYDTEADPTVTVNWEDAAGTVYGGTLDIISGKMIVDRRYGFFGPQGSGATLLIADEPLTAYPNTYVYSNSAIGNAIVPNESAQITQAICSHLPSISRSQAGTGSSMVGIFQYHSGDNNQFRLAFPREEQFSTNEKLNEWFQAQITAGTPFAVCFPLKTPITYQLTPYEVTTLLGNNAVWTDVGSVTVEYPADTSAVISDVKNAISQWAIINSASGDIATFPDGSSNASIKSLTVQIDPSQDGTGDPSSSNIRPIHGKTGITISFTKENLFDKSGDWIPGGRESKRLYLKLPIPDNVLVKMRYVTKTDAPNPTGYFGWSYNSYDANEGVNWAYGSAQWGSSANAYKNIATAGSYVGKYCVWLTAISGNTQEETRAFLTQLLNKYDIEIYYAALEPSEGIDDYDAKVFDVDFQTEVFGATYEAVSGNLVITDAEIDSYNGEELPSTWISDRDVYAEGTTPTIGAQVVYKLASPITSHIAHQEVSMLDGYNEVCSNGPINIEYQAPVGPKIDNLETRINDISDEMEALKDDVYYDKLIPISYADHYTDKYVTGTVGHTVSQTGLVGCNWYLFYVSDYAEAEVAITTEQFSDANNIAAVIATSNGTAISILTGDLSVKKITLPSDGARIYVNCKSPAVPEVFSVVTQNITEVHKDIDDDILANGSNHRIFGKKCVCFGDSITWYDGHAYNWGKEQGITAVGYESYMRDAGMIVDNQGYSGANITNIVNEKVMNFDYTGFDYVTITSGANDSRYNKPVGEIQSDNFDNTFIGRLQAGIEHILQESPEIKILLITPIRGWIYTPNGYAYSPAPEEDGVVEKKYADAIKTVAEYYALPVCDWYSDCGLNLATREWYINDPEPDKTAEVNPNILYSLHPSTKGYKRMAELLLPVLRSI